MRHIRQFILLCGLLLIAHTTIAQVGVKISQMRPKGDIGEYFKKNISYDIYYYIGTLNDHLRSRVGVMYAQSTSRLDTFNVYAVKGSGSSALILPGYEVYHKLGIMGLYIDEDLRIIRRRGVTIFAGLGLMVGKAHMEYDQGYESIITVSNAKVDNTIFGLRFNASVNYKISNHFEVFAAATHNALTVTDWSASYANTCYGLGLNYTIKGKTDNKNKTGK